MHNTAGARSVPGVQVWAGVGCCGPGKEADVRKRFSTACGMPRDWTTASFASPHPKQLCRRWGTRARYDAGAGSRTRGTCRRTGHGWPRRPRHGRRLSWAADPAGQAALLWRTGRRRTRGRRAVRIGVGNRGRSRQMYVRPWQAAGLKASPGSAHCTDVRIVGITVRPGLTWARSAASYTSPLTTPSPTTSTSTSWGAAPLWPA